MDTGQHWRPVGVVNDSCCKVTFQCEDIKTVAHLIEPKDDLVTMDIKNGLLWLTRIFFFFFFTFVMWCLSICALKIANRLIFKCYGF